MDTQDEKAIVRRWFEEVFNEANLEVVDALFAPEHTMHHLGVSEGQIGLDYMKYLITMLRAVSPDLRVVIDDQTAEGDKVVTRWTASGTVQAEVKSADFAGEHIRMSGIDISRIAEGKIVETWQASEAHYDNSLRLREDVRAQLSGALRASELRIVPEQPSPTINEKGICKIYPWLCEPQDDPPTE